MRSQKVLFVFLLIMGAVHLVGSMIPSMPERLETEITERILKTLSVSENLCELSFKWSIDPEPWDYYATLERTETKEVQQLTPGGKITFNLCQNNIPVEGVLKLKVESYKNNEPFESTAWWDFGEIMFVEYDEYFPLGVESSFTYKTRGIFKREATNITLHYDGKERKCTTVGNNPRCGSFSIRPTSRGVWIYTRNSVKY